MMKTPISTDSVHWTAILGPHRLLHVQQQFEPWELVLTWETRNKYKILDERKNQILFAAEKSTGLAGVFMRKFFGHWRSFTVTVFNQQKSPQFTLEFPFRFLFKTLIVKETTGRRIGHAQQRFAIFRKKFDLFNEQGVKVAHINSSFFRFWTFDIFSGDKKVASIKKKWSGALGEFFTDKDNFEVEYLDSALTEKSRAMILSVCLMVDIIYFEKHA